MRRSQSTRGEGTWLVSTIRLMGAAVAVIILVSSLAIAFAADAPIVVTSPWLRATPKGAPVAGGYATITNKGSQPDTLVGASLAGTAKGEIHSMTMDHGVMRMEELTHGLPIAKGATVTLSPGGFHLMFLHPKAPLKEGETAQGTLTFEKAGRIAVTFAIGGMAAKTSPAH